MTFVSSFSIPSSTFRKSTLILQLFREFDDLFLSLSRLEMYMYMCVVSYDSASRIERIFRITLKHLLHNVRPETDIYI